MPWNVFQERSKRRLVATSTFAALLAGSGPAMFLFRGVCHADAH